MKWSDQVSTGISLILRHHRTGLIPTEIGQLINLTELYLHENKLTGRWPKYGIVDQVKVDLPHYNMFYCPSNSCVVPQGAPVDNDGDMYYSSKEKCAEFLNVFTQQ